MIAVEWDEAKRLIANGLNYRYVEISNGYQVLLNDGAIVMQCHLLSGDATEFDASYKSAAKNVLFPVDADGSPLNRPKVTVEQFHFEPRAIGFVVGKAGSLHNETADGTDYGDATLTFYDSLGATLTQGGAETLIAFQARLDLNCVETHLDWQPQYDMDIIGGTFQVKLQPANNLHLWVVVAPDIPAESGGSVSYFSGGFDLSYCQAGDVVPFDGKGVKRMVYDPINNSNKIRTIFKHSPAELCPIQIVVNHYKA